MTQPLHVQTSHPGRKLGRLPNDPTKERLRLKTFLKTGYSGQIPDAVDYLSSVRSWPMALNDRLGCCTASAAAHMTEVWSTYGEGATQTPTDDDVLRFYELCSGYDPSDPSTDQGAVMQDCLGVWRKTGIGGHTIAAFFAIDPHDDAELKAALYLFGGVYVGLDFPNSAMSQFDAGQPWDVVVDDGGIAGGHCVHLGHDTTSDNLQVTTWGEVQQVTGAFWSKYMIECWAPVSLEWIRNNTSPEGLDVAALNAAFTEITNGEPGPFPVAPTPGPTPTPVPPGPTPVPDPPVVDVADRRFAEAVTPLLAHHGHGMSRGLREDIIAWLTAKGLATHGMTSPWTT